MNRIDIKDIWDFRINIDTQDNFHIIYNINGVYKDHHWNFTTYYMKLNNNYEILINHTELSNITHMEIMDYYLLRNEDEYLFFRKKGALEHYSPMVVEVDSNQMIHFLEWDDTSTTRDTGIANIYHKVFNLNGSLVSEKLIFTYKDPEIFGVGISYVQSKMDNLGFIHLVWYFGHGKSYYMKIDTSGNTIIDAKLLLKENIKNNDNTWLIFGQPAEMILAPVTVVISIGVIYSLFRIYKTRQKKSIDNKTLEKNKSLSDRGTRVKPFK